MSSLNIILENTENTENNMNIFQKYEPTLYFYKNGEYDFIFKCNNNFVVNNSKKNPIGTTHHIFAGDTLYISSSEFAGCSATLKFKDSPNDIVLTTTNFLCVNGIYECTIHLPKILNEMKTRKSSKVGFIIISKKNEMIARSSNFWVRSRSRQQVEKDNKRKYLPLDDHRGNSEPPKRLFSDCQESNQETNENQETSENQKLLPSISEMLFKKQKYDDSRSLNEKIDELYILSNNNHAKYDWLHQIIQSQTIMIQSLQQRISDLEK